MTGVHCYRYIITFLWVANCANIDMGQFSVHCLKIHSLISELDESMQLEIVMKVLVDD